MGRRLYPFILLEDHLRQRFLPILEQSNNQDVQKATALVEHAYPMKALGFKAGWFFSRSWSMNEVESRLANDRRGALLSESWRGRRTVTYMDWGPGPGHTWSCYSWDFCRVSVTGIPQT